MLADKTLLGSLIAPVNKETAEGHWNFPTHEMKKKKSLWFENVQITNHDRELWKITCTKGKTDHNICFLVVNHTYANPSSSPDWKHLLLHCRRQEIEGLCSLQPQLGQWGKAQLMFHNSGVTVDSISEVPWMVFSLDLDRVRAQMTATHSPGENEAGR